MRSAFSATLQLEQAFRGNDDTRGVREFDDASPFQAQAIEFAIGIARDDVQTRCRDFRAIPDPFFRHPRMLVRIDRPE